MAISYAWSFPTLDVKYNEDGFQNVVTCVHWTYGAVDGEYSASVYGSLGLPAPGQPFVSFEDLTRQIVEDWVVGVMGQEQVDAMKASLASNIENQKNPISGQMSPPWN